MAYFRDVVDAERWRQLVRVRERDLVRGPLQGDLCPQEETASQCVPVQNNIHFKFFISISTQPEMVEYIYIFIKSVCSGECICSSPHVDVKGLWFVDLEAS